MLARPALRRRARRIVRLAHPDLGELAMQNVVPGSPTPRAGSGTSARTSGEHNDEVYRGLLGLGDDEMAAAAAA